MYGGDGLGRLEGRAVLAPFVLPGERVRLESVREARNVARRTAAKCWMPRRSGWRRRARISRAAADAITSMRLMRCSLR